MPRHPTHTQLVRNLGKATDVQIGNAQLVRKSVTRNPLGDGRNFALRPPATGYRLPATLRCGLQQKEKPVGTSEPA